MTLYEFVKKYNVSKTLFTVYFTFFVLIFYFFSLIIFGQKGLIKYYSLMKEIKRQDINKHELVNEIKIKRTKVEGMNVESLDIDLLDEEARKNLGYAGKNEIVIYQDQKKKD